MPISPTPEPRDSILKRFRASRARGEPVIGGGAGTGISAKWEEAGGIDLIVIYNSGRYRMAGRGSLSGLMPYGNANQIVKEMAYEVLPVVKKTPVLAGVCGTDPFMIPRVFFQELRELGFAGIQNFPTVGLIDGEFRKNLEETGISFRQEVACVALAREMGLLTTPYVFDEEQLRWMLDAGADILVLHMGTTSGGQTLPGGASIGASSVASLDLCVERCRAMSDLARKLRSDVLVLCHGGAIAEPADARYVLEHAPGLDGFYGASSMERLPTEIAIRGQTEKFKSIRLAAR
jgi:predicted TIM-barrel enzyme